jgi:hypothetical protein
MQAGLTTKKLSFRDVFRLPIAAVSSGPMARVLVGQIVIGLATVGRQRPVRSAAA